MQRFFFLLLGTSRNQYIHQILPSILTFLGLFLTARDEPGEKGGIVAWDERYESHLRMC